jgi:hypothetical protein
LLGLDNVRAGGVGVGRPDLSRLAIGEASQGLFYVLTSTSVVRITNYTGINCVRSILFNKDEHEVRQLANDVLDGFSVAIRLDIVSTLEDFRRNIGGSYVASIGLDVNDSVKGAVVQVHTALELVSVKFGVKTAFDDSTFRGVSLEYWILNHSLGDTEGLAIVVFVDDLLAVGSSLELFPDTLTFLCTAVYIWSDNELVDELGRLESETMDGIADGKRLVIRLDLVVLPMEVVSRANHELLESRVVDSIQVVILGLVDLIGDYVFVDGHRRTVSLK